MKKELKKINDTQYSFSLDNFEGPLDLLLHLSRTNEIELTEICLDTLIDQYILFIDNVKDQSIDVSSEYLEMSAELIRLKSQMLLPHITDEEESELEEEIILEREDLINRLIEYKKYREISDELDDLSEKRYNYYSKSPDELKEYRDKSYVKSISTKDFIEATKTFLARLENENNNTKIISIVEISVEEHINELKNLNHSLQLYEKLKTLTRNNQISYFLALLESIKLQYIKFNLIGEDVYIYPRKDNDE